MLKFTIATIAGLSVAAAANAGFSSDVIDLSGQPVPGVNSAPNVITYEQTTSFPLASINFDLEVNTFSPSWGSEIIIEIRHESGYLLTADGSDANFADTGPADVTFGWGDTSGNFTFTGDVVITDGPMDTSGVWTITIFDEFDDGPEPDAVFKDGSSITIKKIPSPGAVALFGIAGLAGIRRRR